MKRRDVLLLAGTVAVGSRILNAQATPCPPPTLNLDGDSTTNSCGTTGTPTWLQGKSTLTWYSLPGTKLSSAMASYQSPGGSTGKPGILAYSGATLKQSGSEVFLNGGGHNDYAGNEVLSLKLSTNAPAWQLRRPPTANISANVDRFSDGRPNSRHTGWDIVYSNRRDRMMLVTAKAWYQNANGGNTVEGFNPNTNDWDHVAGVNYASFPGSNHNVAIPVVEDGAGIIWYIDDYGQVYKFLTNGTWSRVADNPSPPDYPAGGAYDPVRNRVVVFSQSSSAWWDASSNARTGFSFGLSQNGTPVWSNEQSSFLYFPWSGTAVYQVNPATYATTLLNIGGTPPPAPSSAASHTGGWVLGRFFYAPELKICGYIHNVDTDLYYFRTG